MAPVKRDAGAGIEERIAKIREYLTKMTPGPWSWTHNTQFGPAILGGNQKFLFRSEADIDDCRISQEEPRSQWERNITGIVLLRTDAEYLLSEVTRLEQRVRELEGERDELGRSADEVNIRINSGT